MLSAAHVKCYFNQEMVTSIAQLTDEELSSPHVAMILPMGLIYVGGGRYATSTREMALDKATEYSKLQYHCTHRPAEAMRQDTVAMMLA